MLQDYDQVKNHALVADILCKELGEMKVSLLSLQEEGRIIRKRDATVET